MPANTKTNRRRRRFRMKLLPVACLPMIIGCATPAQPAFGRHGPLDQPIFAEVTNHNPQNMVIRVNRQGQRIRLGTVGTLQTRRFMLPPSLGTPSGVFLTADPIGSSDIIQSPTFSTQRGDVLLWTVGSNATVSRFQIRTGRFP